MDCNVCGRADSVLSSIIIDSTAAADLIPKDAEGRFILNDGTSGSSGTVFQAYYFSKENL
jgi:S-DNA-T family DNA segregation ATPase FtsK/SpoIIIE